MTKRKNDDKIEPNWKKAVLSFLKNTTLHGFKYLSSEYLVDRVGWLACCFASTWCAGLLCAVLWARFLQMPALLEYYEIHPNSTIIQRVPRVAICPSTHSVANTFVRDLTTDPDKIKRLPRIVERVLAGKTAPESQLQLLDELLLSKNISLTEAMLLYMPACGALARACRWQNTDVPCDQLLVSELTIRGVCCVMRPDKTYYRLLDHALTRPTEDFETARRLTVALQCSDESTSGCEFFTRFDGEETVDPKVLMPGNNYFVQLRFTSVPQNSAEQFLGSSCIADRSYSMALCLDKCAEQSCGCSDPLRDKGVHEAVKLPPCTVTQLACLRAYGYQENETCNCLPSCNKVTTYTSFEYSPITGIENALDPIYFGLNESTSTVLFMKVNIELSRIFTLNPTETWLTLLSSLGGVFNMFLGVGFFTALEILYLLLFKLPGALRKSFKLNRSKVTKPKTF